MDALFQTLALIQSDIKSLHRDVRKIRQKIDDPTGEKAKARAENNGFKKPIKVDDVLKNFLGLKDGDTISRSEVTRAINKYAEEHNLKNGQVIQMDDALRTLLNPPAGEEVTFLKLQKYLAPHYIKEAKPDSAATPPAEVKKPKVVKKKA